MPSIKNDDKSRVIIRPGFYWDRMPAYLFDIDGTLLRSRDRVHASAFAAGVRRVTGLEITLEGVPTAGNTDTAILVEAWRLTGLDASLLVSQAGAIRAAMAEWVSEHQNELDMILMPGVEAALSHLASRNALLGVATGNLEAIGWLKLTRAGLRDWFRLGGFSDSFLIRAEMVANAAEKARQVLAQPEAVVCVVGDTPRDIAAARWAGLPVVAVATGHTSFDELLALQPEVCATTLGDLLAATVGEQR